MARVSSPLTSNSDQQDDMQNTLRTIVAAVLFLTIAIAPAARADWINLTGAETAHNIAEITVLDDRVNVRLEIYIGNLKTFSDLIPDRLLRKDAPARAPLAERLPHFAKKVFRVLGPDGMPLPVEAKVIEPRIRVDRQSPFAGMINPTTRQRVPGAPSDKRVLYAELDYPFDGKPDNLTFVPPTDESSIPAVNIGFIAYHKAVPIIDFRYLSAPAKVALDWQDPWYSKFENPNLKRHHKSAMMSFLYVEPREVRHEMLIRVRDLRDWTDLGLDKDGTLSSDEQAEVKRRARAFFAKINPLKMDGAPVEPSASQAEFLKISLTGLQVIEDDEPLELSTAIVGIILSYPTAHLPENVAIEWQLFNERIESIPATLIDPAGPLLSGVSAKDRTIEWRNFLLKYQEPKVSPVVLDAGGSIGVPAMSFALLVLGLAVGGLALRPKFLPRFGWIALSAVCLAAAALCIRVGIVNVSNPFAGPPDEKTAAKIVMGTLNNVNSAFVEKQTNALRQAMAIIVAGDRKTDVETELRRALAIKVPGGGIARVDTIENLVLNDTAALSDAAGFRTLAEWTARASAGHWGHVHQRAIRFRARHGTGGDRRRLAAHRTDGRRRKATRLSVPGGRKNANAGGYQKDVVGIGAAALSRSVHARTGRCTFPFEPQRSHISCRALVRRRQSLPAYADALSGRGPFGTCRC